MIPDDGSRIARSPPRQDEPKQVPPTYPLFSLIRATDALPMPDALGENACAAIAAGERGNFRSAIERSRRRQRAGPVRVVRGRGTGRRPPKQPPAIALVYQSPFGSRGNAEYSRHRIARDIS